jgi:hypothetical protein
LLAIAAPNVERRLKPMPSFPALVRQIRRSSLERRVHATAWELPEGQALDIGLHYGVFHYRSSSLSGATRRLEFRVHKGSNRLRVNAARWSRGNSSGLSNTAISPSNCSLRARVKSNEFGPLASRSRASCTIGLRRRTVDGRRPILGPADETSINKVISSGRRVRSCCGRDRSSVDEHAAPAGEKPEQQDAFHDDGCFDQEALRRRQMP